jgi:hypothetical protein
MVKSHFPLALIAGLVLVPSLLMADILAIIPVDEVFKGK